MFGGALGGMLVRRLLPDHHLTKETEDVVRLAIGMIATMSALVVGLLLASSKSSFDTKDSELKQFATDLILLDRQMAHYGPEAKEARDLLRRYTAIKIDAIWPSEGSHRVVADPNSWRLLEDVQDKLRALTPANDSQRWLKERALQLSGDLTRTRWLLHEQLQTSIPKPFMVVLIFWLAVIFGSFGLFAPGNGTVSMALFVCALSIAGAMFLILEMDEPFGGAIRISSAPVRDALALMGQ
ncbi:MAG: DUF4239 domain-containing protein [Deltaproteobacteria bacterium]|nr:MAG: DUF4239 domain-containing protein [Deltaproteobacteria bacterium]